MKLATQMVCQLFLCLVSVYKYQVGPRNFTTNYVMPGFALFDLIIEMRAYRRLKVISGI